jgi:hypothetical protein
MQNSQNKHYAQVCGKKKKSKQTNKTKWQESSNLAQFL